MKSYNFWSVVIPLDQRLGIVCLMVRGCWEVGLS